MEKLTADRHAASGSDEETQTVNASVLTIDHPETKVYKTSAEKEAGSGQVASPPAATLSEQPTRETPRSPASSFGYVRAIVTWMPRNCRYDPESPPKFNLALNLLFALVSSWSRLLVCDTGSACAQVVC